MKKLKQSLKPVQQPQKQTQLQPIQQKEQSIFKKYEEIFTQIVEQFGNVCGVVFQQLQNPTQSIYARYFAGNLIQDTVQWRNVNSVSQIIDFYSNPDHALVINSERLKLREQNGRMLVFSNPLNTYIQYAIAGEYQKHCIFILFTNGFDASQMGQKATQVSEFLTALSVNLDLAKEAEKQQNAKKKLTVIFDSATAFTLSYKNSLKINEKVSYTLKSIDGVEKSANQDFVLIFLDTADVRGAVQRIAQFTQKVQQLFIAVYFLGRPPLGRYYFSNAINQFWPTSTGPVLPEFGLAEALRERRQLVIRFNTAGEVVELHHFLEIGLAQMTAEYFRRPPYAEADRLAFHLSQRELLLYNMLIEPFRRPGKVVFTYANQEDESILGTVESTKHNQDPSSAEILESQKATENVSNQESGKSDEKEIKMQNFNIISEIQKAQKDEHDDQQENYGNIKENNQKDKQLDENEENKKIDENNDHSQSNKDVEQILNANSKSYQQILQNEDISQQDANPYNVINNINDKAQTNVPESIPQLHLTKKAVHKYPQNQISNKIQIEHYELQGKPILLAKLARDVPKSMFEKLKHLQEQNGIIVYVCMERMKEIMIETIIKKVPAAAGLGFVIESSAGLERMSPGIYTFDQMGRQCGEWRDIGDFDGKIVYEDIDDVD